MKRIVSVLLVLSVVTAACAGGAAMPTAGTYSVQKNSVQFDGERYQLYYADASGAVQRLESKSLRMVRDNERTYLEVPASGDPILHLREDEPITVQGQDNGGAFSSPWFPFLVGAMVGNSFGSGWGTPQYRYPPTDTFGRGDQLRGSVETTRPQLPDYSKMQPAPNATTGQSAGTGGGVAASNKGSFAKGSSAQVVKPNTGVPSVGGGGKGLSGARSGSGPRVRR
jgi:hypothetical protein